MPPKLATPVMVLAADPPDSSTPLPMAAWRLTARSVSMRVMDPFTSA